MHSKRFIFLFPLIAILTGMMLFSVSAFSAEAAPQQQTTTNARGCDDTITVTIGTHSGTGSLRQAVADVCPGGTVLFANSMTVTLNSIIIIDKQLTIDGGSAAVAVSGADSSALFEIDSSAVVTFTQFTIVDGFRPLENNGELTVDGMRFASNGESSLVNNGIARVTNSIFFANVDRTGKGTINNTAMLTVTNTLFKDNDGAIGAGLRNFATGTAHVSNSTFTGGFSTSNQKIAPGVLNEGILTVTHSTFEGNITPGTILARNGTAALINNVFANNQDVCRLQGGTITVNSGNWADIDNCNVAFVGDPKLAPLGDYGGPTETFALQLDSGLHQAVSANCAATDARGVTRGSSCDIGAFESQGATLSIVSGDGQLALVNSPFAEPLAVQVTAIDSAEPLVQAGAVVAFTAPSSGASLSTATFTETLDASGTAIAIVASNAITGTYTVTAGAGGDSAGFTLTNFESQGVTLSILSGDGQSADLDTPFAEPLAIQVAVNNPIDPLVLAGEIVTFTAPSSGPSLSTATFTATLDASGTATASVSSNDIFGTYSVIATVFDESVTFTLTNSGCFPAAVVENDNDAGAGSLRRSVLNLCDGGTITFADAMTVALATEIDIAKRVTIEAEDLAVTISGESVTRIFNIAASGALSLTQVTVANGASSGSGGAIRNEGSLSVHASLFTDNASTAFGGAIANEGQLSIVDSQFLLNDAGAEGGAIDSTDSAEISNTVFYSNTADTTGGAISAFSGSMSLVDVDIQHNVAEAGGGIAIGSGGAAESQVRQSGQRGGGGGDIVSLTNCTITNNVATQFGGGIAQTEFSTQLLINDCAINNNTATDGGGGLAITASAEITGTIFMSNTATTGGGIYSDFGNLLLTEITIEGNSATGDGGGVFSTGTWRMTDSQVLSNSAGDDGGGLALGGSTNTLERVSVRNNVATDEGGGINFFGVFSGNPRETNADVAGGESLLISKSTIADNQAANGAGIYNHEGLTIEASTISGNQASVSGGGLYNASGSADIVNCTISGNSAAGADSAGGIDNNFGFSQNVKLSLAHCTVTGNSGGAVGGILHDGESPLRLAANIIAGNTGSTATAVAVAMLPPRGGGGSGPSAENVFGQSGQSNADTFSNFLPGDSDFIATDDGTPTALSSILDTTLADNGGFSLTHALLSSSPALELELSCSVFDDQRGVQRPVGTACDAGAFESDLVPTAVALADVAATPSAVNNVLLLLLPVLLVLTVAALQKRPKSNPL